MTVPPSLVVIIPKHDEWLAVRRAFALDNLTVPDVHQPTGLSHYRAMYAGWEITFCLMSQQNTTNTAVATSLILDKVKPRYAFLVGTALGRPPATTVGSVVIGADGLYDLIERRVEQEADITRTSYSVYTLQSPPNLAISMRDFVATTFGSVNSLHRHIREASRMLHWKADRVRDFLATYSPRVVVEPIASGNDYFMGDTGPAALLWDVHGKPKAYDMESAGFARAAHARQIEWLTIRGISDYGTAATKADDHRFLSTYAAAHVLATAISKALRADRHDTGEPAHTLGQSDVAIRGDAEFFTLDRSGFERLPEILADVTRLGVFGRTAINFVKTVGQPLAGLMKRGAEFQLLLVDPLSPVARHLYGQNHAVYVSNLREALQALNRLAPDQASNSLVLRLVDEFPPFTLILLDRNIVEQSEIWVQLNFMRTRVGTDRPVLRLTPSNPWYPVFRTEYEVLWNYSNKTDIANLIANIGSGALPEAEREVDE